MGIQKNFNVAINSWSCQKGGLRTDVLPFCQNPTEMEKKDGGDGGESLASKEPPQYKP